MNLALEGLNFPTYPAKIVEIYRPGQQSEIQEGRSAVYGEGPVGGFVLELARIWG